MAQLFRKQTVGIKTESTQGTAVALTTTDFTHAYDVSITPMVELTPQNYVSTSLSRFADIPGKKYYEIEFTLPLRGSGTAGTANTPLGAALQACGLTETVSGGVSVTYAPTSSAASSNFYGPGKSATVKIYQDGMLHVAAGCLFDVSFDLEAGKPVGLKFKGKGIYAAVTDASFASTSILATNPPIIQSASATLQTFSAKIAKMSMQLGIQITEIPDVNSTAGILGFQITDRQVTGNVDANRELVATHDFWGKMMSGAEAAWTIAIGSTAGNIITISGSKMQYGQFKSGNRNGVASLEGNLLFNRSSGDDEVSIVFT